MQFKGALTAALIAALPATAIAQDRIGDGKPWQDYYAAMEGKTVAFVPMALSFDLAQLYDGAMRSYAEEMGFEYLVRDPNWSVEGAVQVTVHVAMPAVALRSNTAMSADHFTSSAT